MDPLFRNLVQVYLSVLSLWIPYCFTPVLFPSYIKLLSVLFYIKSQHKAQKDNFFSFSSSILCNWLCYSSLLLYNTSIIQADNKISVPSIPLHILFTSKLSYSLSFQCLWNPVQLKFICIILTFLNPTLLVSQSEISKRVLVI